MTQLLMKLCGSTTTVISNFNNECNGTIRAYRGVTWGKAEFSLLNEICAVTKMIIRRNGKINDKNYFKFKILKQFYVFIAK